MFCTARNLNPTSRSLSLSLSIVIETGLSLTYIYVLLLDLVSVYGRPAKVAGHLTFVLISTLGVYLYRDVLPLCTFSGVPQDPPESILWVKIGVLGFTGISVPLLAPRRYIPVDPGPLEPVTVPNPEQTASIISLTFYAFLDPTIIRAHRLTRLPYDPLADYDAAKYLRSRNFEYIERRRHLFWGLARVFRADILILAGTSAFK
ncbi:hypothetical protein C8R47DRAFT_425478 [Mycena vitilis]|nr:hypothetical protein C8R47DRAFT_425478 [Mycena vitilis]